MLFNLVLFTLVYCIIYNLVNDRYRHTIGPGTFSSSSIGNYPHNVLSLGGGAGPGYPAGLGRNAFGHTPHTDQQISETSLLSDKSHYRYVLFVLFLYSNAEIMYRIMSNL